VVLFLSPGAIIVLFKNNISLLEFVGFFKLSAKVEDEKLLFFSEKHRSLCKLPPPLKLLFLTPTTVSLWYFDNVFFLPIAIFS
jgi:hypothetical protein